MCLSKSEEKTPPKLPLLVPKSKEGSTSQDTDAEDDDDEGDAMPMVEEEAVDVVMVAELPQGHIDPRVQ